MTALSGFPISARAAAIDLARARRWYEQRLGLVPKHEDPGGVWYRFAGDTWLYLYRMTLLAGLLDVGGVGARSVGALWLVCAVGFVVAGVALWRAEPWAMPLVVGLALGSLVLCVLGSTSPCPTRTSAQRSSCSSSARSWRPRGLEASAPGGA
jgi:hypothetical protein